MEYRNIQNGILEIVRQYHPPDLGGRIEEYIGTYKSSYVENFLEIRGTIQECTETYRNACRHIGIYTEARGNTHENMQMYMKYNNVYMCVCIYKCQYMNLCNYI